MTPYLRWRKVTDGIFRFDQVLMEASYQMRLGLDPDMTVDEIMRCWPGTIRVFLRHGMLCVGCPVGNFHTVADACDAHELDREMFTRELASEIQAEDRDRLS